MDRKEYNKKWMLEHPGYHKEWAKNHKEERLLTNKKVVAKLKDEVFEKYGNKCACCGETQREFLVIDHINGGGNIHRKSMTNNGQAIYYWLRKNNYPEGFQILCCNCNSAKAYYGECPHQKK